MNLAIRDRINRKGNSIKILKEYMDKNITFETLSEKHFSLLLKWLETPHVKKWWDQDIHWTPELIEKKYSNYVKGLKRLELATRVIEKPMYAFIINFDGVNIGYIQYTITNTIFQLSKAIELPENCAAIDWYIGELDYIGKGIGPQALNIFLNEFIFKVSENAFVDPDTANIRAIRSYEKVGFKKISENNGTTLMVKTRIP